MAKGYGGKRNALKHGAYVREILPGESLEEFEALHHGLIKEWKPSGTLEEQTVMSLARAVWCKDRVNRFYYDEAYWVEEPEEDELNHVHSLANLLESASTIEMADSIISVLPELYREFMSDELAQTKNGDLRDIPKLGEKLHDFLITREEFVNLDRLSYKKKFEKARQLRELTAKKIALDERLDSHIDKALKRLAHLKAFKQIAQTSTLEIVDQTDKDQ